MATPENHKMQILIRKDLTMRKGKMIAQGSHGVLELSHNQTIPSLRDIFNRNWWKQRTQFYRWFKMGQKKISLGVDDLNDLMDIFKKANEAGIPAVVILDEGLTEFNGRLTTTCVVLGPVPDPLLKPITGHLKPL